MSFEIRYDIEWLEPRVLLSIDAPSTASAFTGMPAVFVPNRGQWDRSINFGAHGTGADILFTKAGPTFRLIDRPDDAQPERRGHFSDPAFDELEMLSVSRPVTATEWSLTFVDAARVSPSGLDRQETIFNYYLGNDPAKWRAGVKSYGGVVYENLWNGIDAHVLAQPDGMKYEFHVAPNADPRDIALRYDGVQRLSLNKNGALSIQTPAGTITDDSPIAWQTSRDGTRVDVKARFVLLDEFTYTIAPTGAYDRSLPLVLDPQLEFGSFLGGSELEASEGIVPDGAGGAWVTGATESADFPTPGGFDTTFNGFFDTLVARVSADGQLAFASFLGGPNFDVGRGVASDGAGGAWVTGEASNGFPTPGGFDATFNGVSDAFVARVAANGTLVFASYLGGSTTDHGWDIDSDGAGGAWVTGDTRSNNFPTPGGFDTSISPGGFDAFIVHISGTALAFGSYFGGSGYDDGHGVTSDGQGGAWLTGETGSVGLATSGAFDSTLNINDSTLHSDGYVAHVGSGGTLAYASYLGGGNGNDLGVDVAPDGTGGVWVTGSTKSTTFPATSGFDPTYNGSQDVFVAHVTTAGALVFATYLGGIGVDEGTGVATDGAGGAWVTGGTDSFNFPTPDGFDKIKDGQYDAIVARFAAVGTLTFGSHLGGTDNDYAYSVAPDGSGGVWVAGATISADFPTPGGFDTTYNGGDEYGGDVFVARIDGTDSNAPTVTASLFVYESSPQSIRIIFSENVSASLSIADLALENLTTGQTIPAAHLSLAYTAATNIATFTFPGYEYGVLPNGTYRATLLAAGVTDFAGNPLPSNRVIDFFFRQGDANHDNVIDFDDFVLIDQGFNNVWSGFANGDFNYDGVVDFDDYVIIDLAFNTQ